MWYEIHTGTAECVDEVDADKGSGEGDNGTEDEFSGIGDVEEDAPERKTRLNVSRSESARCEA